MPGRPHKLQPDEALEKAMLLFWEHGYESTSLNMLEQHLGAGRQSIYNTFGDKKSLFLQAYRHYLNTHLQAACELLQQGNTPQEKLRNLFYNTLDCADGKHLGCFVGNTIATPSAHQPEIEAVSDEAVKKFTTALRATISPLYTDKEQLNATTWNLFVLFQGCQLVAKQKNIRKNLIKAINRTIDHLP